jgi:hypothetical protein
MVKEALSKLLDRFPPDGPRTVIPELVFDGNSVSIPERAAFDIVMASSSCTADELQGFSLFLRSVQASRRRIDALLAPGGVEEGVDGHDGRSWWAGHRFRQFFTKGLSR